MGKNASAHIAATFILASGWPKTGRHARFLVQVGPTVWLVPLTIFVQIGWFFLLYLRASKPVTALADSGSNSTMRYIDLPLIAWKNKRKRLVSWLFLLPFMVSIGALVYVFSQYDMIPQMMATHWAISGDADHFTEKNMPTALMPGLLFLLLISMMLWLTRNTFETRFKLNPERIESSRKAVQSYINTVTGANYLISLFISLLSAITAYSVVNGEAFPVVIAYPALFLPIASIVMFIVAQTNVRKAIPLDVEFAQFSIEDDERFWTWNTFYHNPDDPALFVKKRTGTGLTVNTGRPVGRVVVVLCILLIGLLALYRTLFY